MVDTSNRMDREQFCNLRQQACPIRIEVAEIWKELEGSKKAMELAASSLNMRLEGMNEVREQLNKQAAETIRREEVMLMMEKHTETFGLQITSLRTLIDDVKERENRVILMLGVALLALAGNFALQLILHLVKHP